MLMMSLCLVGTALSSQIPIGITGCIITQSRGAAAHRVWGLVESTSVKVMKESGVKSNL